MLNLYNTMTRQRAPFTPMKQGEVSLYTCGPTVYNYAHIGNLRTYVFEDVLKRVLAWEDFEVRHVMNITDVGHLTSDADTGEDKMAAGAAREGRTVWEIAAFYTDCFKKDMARLNLIEPDIWCKATDHMAEQIELIQSLEEKGYTYRIVDGIYFDTEKLSDYGKLAQLDTKGLKAGARVEMVEGKRRPTDFALWKFSPKNTKRLMEWDSPWGVGFPGWHTECAAMAIKYLGEQLDIHCGGVDHISVHHTNEIAQSEAVTGKNWVNWWLHGEFLVLGGKDDNEKMAKSGGNFITMDTLIDRGYDLLAYRYFCLNAHYRAQLQFSWQALDSAASALDSLKQRVADLSKAGNNGTPSRKHMDTFREAVEDDLNMPRALAAMWGALKDQSLADEDRYVTVLAMEPVLGLGMKAMTPGTDEVDEDTAALIAERDAARKAKDFARADEIRDILIQKGVTLKDTIKL